VRPRPAPPDLFRKLPAPAPARQAGPPGSGPERVVESREVAATAAQVPEPELPLPAPPAPPARPAGRLEPIAEQRHVLRVTVGADFAADLEAVRAELSHKLPAGDLEAVLHECIRVTLEACRRRRRGAGKKTSAKPPPRKSRYIPAAIRAEVWRRDAGQCTFVGTTGHRCASRHRLQVHHIDPRGKDGETTVANLTLRCQAHNLYAAEKDYGREHIARKIARTTSRAKESVGTSPLRVRPSQPSRPALPRTPGAGMRPQPRPQLRRARVAAAAADAEM
jgi:5-methylcytosine-specific restriction endonuclease McrA